MMDIRVLLIVQDDRAKQIYLDLLKKYGIQVFVSPSFQNLSDDICSHTYHGIFIDLPTKMKALKENRNYVYGLVEKFPVVQLKLNEQTGSPILFHSRFQSGWTLDDFIFTECKNFVPRMIRSDARKDIHLNVLLYATPDDADPERTVTINLSRGGCFLFSSREWKMEDDVWISIHELSDRNLIRCQIRHVIHWGESMRISGIGIEFSAILEEQQYELSNRFLKYGS
ncbi:MAG: PilZ domain-containing protein [Desulfatirhabdiaceae bacterium]